MKSRWLAILLVFTVCGGWLALASPPSPTPTPGSQIQMSSEALGKALGPVKFNCPTMSYAGQPTGKPTVGGSEAAGWVVAKLNKQGIQASEAKRIKRNQFGYDYLQCTYTIWDGPSEILPEASALFRVSRSAPKTHPICKVNSNTKSFECRMLKQGESYFTAQY